MEGQMNLKKWNALATAVLLSTAAFATDVLAQTGVPSANPRSLGVVAPNILSPELTEAIVAQGAMKLENPSGPLSHYGYNNDGTMIPTGNPAVEATKTEPDKNTYLVLKGQKGFDPLYDYGTHFLYQGHESGVVIPPLVPKNNGDFTHPEIGYITRINLDADGAHRVTLLATQDNNHVALPDFDGSVWYPFSKMLLFTAEIGQVTSGALAPANQLGGVWQATPNYPSTVTDLRGILGAGGYEGIQADDTGKLYIVEDVSGNKSATLTGPGGGKNVRQPNSFVYRFVPNQISDLSLGGKLQVLQVLDLTAAHNPIEFHANNVDGDISSPTGNQALHTYGKVFTTKWITIHDTGVSGFAPFDANTLAKAAHGTPFKRPENGQFRPRSGFSEFFFTETGDTNADVPATPGNGSFGALYRLNHANLDSGQLNLFYLGDVAHTGLDNISFWSDHEVVAVEDAGDTLHGQRNALDSAYLFDLNTDYSNSNNQPTRILAEGRDASATTDSLFGFPYNDGDNEITGWHVSDGDSSVKGLIGTNKPSPFKQGWRVFYTQQHGDNITWEILPVNSKDSNGDDDNNQGENQQ